MYTGILDVSLSLCCKFLTQVCGVLIFDVLYDGIPAASRQLSSLSIWSHFSPSVIVDLITVAWGIHDIEP